MKIVDALLNRSEEVVYRELQNISADNGLRVFAKTRLSDVLQKGKTFLTQREFDFFTRSHFDFVVADAESRPLMVIEYDGPLHQTSAIQQERDKIKNSLCRSVGLGMLRINDRHVTKLYRGMTVLRWIVEVTELKKAFYEAQEGGQIPADEDFDPTLIDDPKSTRRFPYWLSARYTQSFHDYFKFLAQDMSKGWNSVLGRDGDENGYRLSCLHFGDRVLWAKTAVRKQDLDFPDYDLLEQLDTCELGECLKLFREGEMQVSTLGEFRSVFERFCERYNARPSHSMGAFPFEFSWKR
jgi:hypothetical protein